MINRVRMSCCLLFVCTMVLGGQGFAQTTDADIEAVQRKLDAAKQAQAAKDAAARRKAEERAAREAAERQERAAQASAERQQREAEAAAEAAARDAAAAAEAQKGTMIIKSDTPCELKVNGESQGSLEAGATRQVKVNAGEQLIECAAGDGRSVEQTEEISSGKQSVVRLSLPALERFGAVADGIADRDQQLIWASSDNGSDITWGDAQRYCSTLGAGWALPTVAALQSLYDASGAYGFSRTYANQTLTIKPATSLIDLTGC